MFNIVKIKEDDRISYKINFEEKYTNKLYGEIHYTKKDYQVVITYRNYWIYQEFAKTLKQALKIVERNEEWLYTIAEHIDKEVSCLVYTLCHRYKTIIDRNGFIYND